MLAELTHILLTTVIKFVLFLTVYRPVTSPKVTANEDGRFF